jgi:hypothetical protein
MYLHLIYLLILPLKTKMSNRPSMPTFQPPTVAVIRPAYLQPVMVAYPSIGQSQGQGQGQGQVMIAYPAIGQGQGQVMAPVYPMGMQVPGPFLVYRN